MEGGCQEKHFTVGRQPGQKQQRRGSQPQFSVTRTDAPAVEELQSMSDIVRNRRNQIEEVAEKPETLSDFSATFF